MLGWVLNPQSRDPQLVLEGHVGLLEGPLEPRCLVDVEGTAGAGGWFLADGVALEEGSLGVGEAERYPFRETGRQSLGWFLEDGVALEEGSPGGGEGKL